MPGCGVPGCGSLVGMWDVWFEPRRRDTYLPSKTFGACLWAGGGVSESVREWVEGARAGRSGVAQRRNRSRRSRASRRSAPPTLRESLIFRLPSRKTATQSPTPLENREN